MKAISEPPSESSTAVVRDVILPLEEEEDYDEEEEVDTFERLGRMGDEAVALEMKRRADETREVEAAEENENEKERKQKRKRKDGEVKVKSGSKGKRSRT